MSKIFTAAVAACAFLAFTSQASANQQPAQLEQCGAFVRVAPWCGEAMRLDTRQLQAMQIVPITLSPSASERWGQLHRERRRGIPFTETNAQGETVQSGRPVITALARVIARSPSGREVLYQALIAPDMTNVMVLLPAEVNFAGWTMYIIAGEGRNALTLSGQLIELGGRNRTDGHLTLDYPRLPASVVTSTTLVRRGDGTGIIEGFEATFVEHKVIHDRNGRTRVYSGLRYTFTPPSEGEMSVATGFTNCRRVDDRLVERGNLRVDTGTVSSAVATGGLTAIPLVIQNGLAILRRSCR